MGETDVRDPVGRVLVALRDAGRTEGTVRRQQGVLEAFAITPEQFRIQGPLKVKGARRSLRFAAEGLAASAGEDEHGHYLEVRFAAPSGSYATVLTDEIMKGT